MYVMLCYECPATLVLHPAVQKGMVGRGAAALGVDKEEEQRRLEKTHGRLDERSAAERHCQQLACQLQACASRYVYKPEKCNGLKVTYSACIADFLAASEKAEAEANRTEAQRGATIETYDRLRTR